MSHNVSETRERGSAGKRIQFEFSADAMQRLDTMKAETNATSYAGLVRDALRVYEWVVQQQKDGYEIGLVKDNTLAKTVKFML